MELKLKSVYNFVDISVMQRVGINEYVNLTECALVEKNQSVIIHSDYPLLLTFCAFAKQGLYIAPVTLKELLTLANIRNDNFIKQLYTGVDKSDAEQIIAILCAKKILSYDYGKAMSKSNTDEITYEFKRQRFVEGKRIYPVVLTKTFQKA